MDDIATNLRTIEDRIAAACRKVEQDPSSVRLLPVSKTMSTDKIMAAYDAGYRRFGENKVQEAHDKWERLSDVDGLEWAVIGHLQRNKARLVAQFASEFEALDSLRLAKELDKRLQAQGRRLDVLVQVNSSGEESKFGLAPEAVVGFARELAAFDALRVRGLMTLAVFSSEQTRVAQCFQRMVDVRERLRQADDVTVGEGWEELSMGMSGDFELAIEYGATVVRVGQAIFGARLDPNAYWPGAGEAAGG
ncbi:MAG: YggS family pyridoxal phosphate-dependent enzyme [Intrasporangium sp.]|uniref:YggS family pyridoxal phosphate-dependent enzyme n=1 Tax=Intrasporangium sp. TaxID=1925024 RepID=UPI00264996E3|nr:YggS family pyridoxal phosphate-dependent enzyme [Intrasporangium sp.]MDN5798067.1 YggS family pyridoxal phosphate-dependent enzyme [Intrasporangium sp.]